MKLADAVDESAACAKSAGDRVSADLLSEMRQWLESPVAHVVVCGEFKRGKSSLVNALLGQRICPEDRLPATAVPAVLSHGELSATVVYNDGRSEPIEPTMEGLSALSVGSATPSDEIRFVRVELPSPLLADGLVMVDTPGVNDLSQQRADVTYRFLPLCDAAVVVLDATAPVTASESRFLKDRVFPEMLERVVFLLGKADRLDEDELEEALQGAHGRLKALLGREVEVIPVSTRQGAAMLAPVFDYLKRVTRDARDDRGDRAGRRLRRLVEQMLDDVEARVALAREPARLEEAQLALDAEHTALLAKFERLVEYIDGFGRETLEALVHRSLKKLDSDVLGDLRYQIEAAGDIERFMRLHLPRRVEVALKQWSEVKGREIDVFQRKLLSRVAEDFSTHLLLPLDESTLPGTLERPEVSLERGQARRSRTKALAKDRILPMAALMGVGLMFGPMGVVAGGLAGQVAGTKLTEVRQEAERVQALAQLDGFVHATFEGFEAALQQELTAWFDALEHSLRRGLDEAKRRVQQRLLSSDTGSLDQVVLDLRRLHGRLEEAWPTS